jgi:hypothetical protein
MAQDLKNTIFRFYLRNFFPPDFSAVRSIKTQERIFQKLIGKLSSTAIAIDTGLNKVKTYSNFKNAIPVTQYDFYEKYIERIKTGEQNVMTPDRVRYFGKTAGTTSGKSKLIPITTSIVRNIHVRGTFFGLSRIHSIDKKIDILSRKNFVLSGGIYEKLSPSGIIVGDISAIMMWNVPLPFRTIYVPDIELSTHPSWDYKINRVAELVSKADVGTISGVPTWHLAVLAKIRDEIKFSNLHDLWKNLRIFFHGGVSFEPYRKHFKELLGREDFIFYEIYNATEGFFGIQVTLEGGDLLLLTDNGIFFEFIPFSEFTAGISKPIPLSEVKTGVPYVLIITTPNGLLRYAIGDVITFTSLDPYQFRITGRTQEYINAFGEDLLLSNVQNALMKTNAKFDCSIKEYTVAPFYINIDSKGRMQFLIEFRKAPGDLAQYANELDQQLQKENSNYAQKRNNDLALTALEIIPAKENLFYKWMASKGKMGGQNKIPRLVNGRKVMEEMLTFNQ